MALTDAEINAAKGDASGLNFYGNADEKVSPYLKAWIAQPDKDSKISTLVIGLIGPGTSRSLQANWNSPFEQSNLGGMFEKVGGMLQAASQETSVTTFSSTQIWEGNRPHSFNLVLSLYALKDAYKEVMAPLKELEKMMGPNIAAGSEGDGAVMEFLKSAKPGGRIPQPVIINIGRRMLIPNCVIENISAPLDGPRTAEGYLVKADITLSIATKTMLNRQNIAATWP